MNLRDLDINPADIGAYMVLATCVCGHRADAHWFSIPKPGSILDWPSIDGCSTPRCRCINFTESVDSVPQAAPMDLRQYFEVALTKAQGVTATLLDALDALDELEGKQTE